MYVELEMAITHGHKSYLNNVKKYFNMCDTIMGFSDHPNNLVVGLNWESSQTITNRKSQRLTSSLRVIVQMQCNKNNNVQRRAIQPVFEHVGPTLLKDPLGVGWDLQPTLL